MAAADAATTHSNSVSMDRRTPVVDVIVPAYRDLPLTRRCIESVLRSPQRTPFELIVINDCSPEPELDAYLESLRGAPQVTVLRNGTNLGFVATVNLGMTLHPDRDVVLLNSDTEVANDWLDRLRRCALSRQDIGTVTPFSNNATICSYPEFCADNELPPGVSLVDLDAAFARANAGEVAQLPTAVGFCMYIRRDCLQDIGPFDASHFGKGYGEENDFSLRAAGKGWLNVLCADVFIYHEGGASFRDERTELQARAGAVLDRLHPTYRDEVRSFILKDPLWEMRHAVNMELATTRRSERNHRGERPSMRLQADIETRTVVLLYAEPANWAFVIPTLRSIALGSLTCKHVIAAGDWTNGAPDDEVIEATRGIPVSFVSSEESLLALRSCVTDCGAVGAFLVSAGLSLPRGFDVRLTKIASEVQSLDSVSPLCDVSPAHRIVDGGAPLDETEAARLDRLAFLLGRKAYLESDRFLPECCFVPAAVLLQLESSNTGTAAGKPGWIAQLSSPGRVHACSDSVYVGTLPGAVFPHSEDGGAQPHALVELRSRVLAAFNSGVDFHGTPGVDGRPVQLHVLHDMGGGSAKWLKDYCLADTERINLVLKSFSHSNAMGCGVALYSHVLDETPLRSWRFSREIQATAVTHLEYRSVLKEIIDEYCVDGLLVSSLIGHTLDTLDTGLPTLVVTHDYFPYCPAINLHFGGVCRQCDEQRIEACFKDNPKFNPFVTFLPAERIRVRNRFLELIQRPNITMVAPSKSVADNLLRLDSRFAGACFVGIPHGYGGDLKRRDSASCPPVRDRLRILVLGQLSVLKGVELLTESLETLKEFAEVYLLGCGELGELFRFQPGVHVVSQYEIEELPDHVAAINPHFGLLASICPETFSYALTELMMLGVPVAATNVGSFPERIRHGETGYLYDPDPASLIGTLRAIDADRDTLKRIRRNLSSLSTARNAASMVSDYHKVLPLPRVHTARYPLGTLVRATPGNAGSSEGWSSSAATIAKMWKEVKSLHLQLSMSSEARQRADTQVNRERLVFQERLTEFEQVLDARQQQIQVLEKQVQDLANQVNHRDAQLHEILSSTSWRISRPIRWAGRGVRRLRVLGHAVAPALRDPASLPTKARKLLRVWRSGGLPAVKSAILRARTVSRHADAWTEYRQTFQREVRPRIVKQLKNMHDRPLISIIVPTYNTPERMLREMLESVRQQLYPDWELCISDDASSQPHVKAILQEYARQDPRIKLHFEGTNKGVSHASNRALELATGNFAILLDHDDVLEEQALFRVAESIIDDDPDMLYSDEVLVSADRADIKQFVYRPTFSPEYLRSHPYIVHLVGFRTDLLRDIGAFDESLSISQDYDLILRATERARTIVHIPEILYQWRVHGESSGHRKMHEVMETSTALLQKHLERCGEAGRVGPGLAFNLFEIRYPLRDDLRVAVIIPTKNHGDLIKQCIDSIRNTVRDVAYDIVVVDHESDDRSTLAYLSSIENQIRIVRHSGPFNFSAINNRAVAQLSGQYSHYLFCNNDIEAIQPGWLERMLELGQRSSVGVVGAKLLYPDRESIQHAGVCVGAYGKAEHYGKFVRVPQGHVEAGYQGRLVLTHEVSAVTAACMLVRRDAFEEVSGFDEDIAVGFGDVDLCLRIGQRGFRILFCPNAELIHHESYTRGTSIEDTHPNDTALYRSKWQALLSSGDPYYSPGLSLQSTTWEIQHPLECRFTIRRRIIKRDRQSNRDFHFFSSNCAKEPTPRARTS